MELFAVTAQFGHVGRNWAIVKTVATIADCGKDAAFRVRWMGRVKHDRKDAILDVKKITAEEYAELKAKTELDGYFLSHSKQEQMRLCPNLREEKVLLKKESLHDKDERRRRISYKMKKEKLKQQSYEFNKYEVFEA